MKTLKYLVCLFLLVACTSPSIGRSFASVVKLQDSVEVVDVEPFYWHQDIVTGLANGFNLSIKGVNLLDNVKVKSGSPTEKTYTSFHRDDFLCYRTVARGFSGKPYADFWVQVSFGHTGDSRPLYPRSKCEIVISGIRPDTIILDDPPNGATVFHGQGLPMKHFRYDFTVNSVIPTQEIVLIPAKPIPPWNTVVQPPSWIKDYTKALIDLRRGDDKTYAPFEQTRFTPSYPGQTGDQAQFGTYLIAPEIYAGTVYLDIWRKQLYQESCRPIHLLNPDGSRATEDQYPNTIYDGFFHGGAKGTHWIKYTDLKSPWGDMVSITNRWYGWDDQHWSLGALCQVYRATKDPGLEMILGDLTEIYFWSTPVVDKGTTHHIGGAARALGREVEAGSNLYWALEGTSTALRLKQRVETLLRTQVKEWDERVSKTGSGIKLRHDGYSVWEHGLWVKGMSSAFLLIDDPTLLAKLKTMLVPISIWILDGFKDWGNGDWAIPYLLFEDGTWSDSPSHGLSDWCLPSLQILNKFEQSKLNTAQKLKLGAIIKHLTTNSPPGNKGWLDNFRWRLY